MEGCPLSNDVGGVLGEEFFLEHTWRFPCNLPRRNRNILNVQSSRKLYKNEKGISELKSKKEKINYNM